MGKPASIQCNHVNDKGSKEDILFKKHNHRKWAHEVTKVIPLCLTHHTHFGGMTRRDTEGLGYQRNRAGFRNKCGCPLNNPHCSLREVI